MANETISPNMNLPIPVVGVAPNPTWAQDINACLTLVDQHNHSAGSGVQITPSGLNINSNLPLNINSLTLVKSIQFSTQTSLSSLYSAYFIANDFYINDGAGNVVRITQSGGVSGTPGSIANLTSPASATYVSASSSFVWQSAASTPANMDGGSVIFRNIAASSSGVTVSAPNALGSSYSLVLPTLPAAQKFMTLDASGNMSAPWSVDNSTIVVSSNTVQVPSGGINTAQIATSAITTSTIANNAVTPAKLSSFNSSTSASSGTFSTASTTIVTVTNLSVTITSSGRPIYVSLICDGSNNASEVYNLTSAGVIYFIRNNGNIALQTVESGGIPPSSFNYTDIIGAGTYTYVCWARSISGSTGLNYCKLIAYEI